MTTSAQKQVNNFTRASAYDFAQAKRQFFIDHLPLIYTVRCKALVTRHIKQLNDPYEYQVAASSSNVLFEMVVADILKSHFPDVMQAEEAGYSNACGYDVFGPKSGIYLEMKEASVRWCSGNEKSALIAASASNMKNKFCSVLALVIDPYLRDRPYQLYLVTPDIVPNDLSDELSFPHHVIDRTSTKYSELIEQRIDLGGATYSKCRIDSLAELPKRDDDMKKVNVKKLANVLGTLQSPSASDSQKAELTHLRPLFDNVTQLNTRAKTAKGVTKLSKDPSDMIYSMSNNHRLLFSGKRNVATTLVEPLEKDIITTPDITDTK